jgi:hypothetical protein
MAASKRGKKPEVMPCDLPLRVTRFRSIMGWTYVLSEGFCVLGYYTARMEAEAALAERLKRQKSPDAPPPPEEPPPGSIVDGGSGRAVGGAS